MCIRDRLWKASRRLKSCWLSAIVTQTNIETQPMSTRPVCMAGRPMLRKRK